MCSKIKETNITYIWRGTFYKWEEPQSTGYSYGTNNFEIRIKGIWVPFDWNKLRDFSKTTYDRVYGRLTEVFKDTSCRITITFRSENYDKWERKLNPTRY